MILRPLKNHWMSKYLMRILWSKKFLQNKTSFSISNTDLNHWLQKISLPWSKDTTILHWRLVKKKAQFIYLHFRWEDPWKVLNLLETMITSIQKVESFWLSWRFYSWMEKSIRNRIEVGIILNFLSNYVCLWKFKYIMRLWGKCGNFEHY